MRDLDIDLIDSIDPFEAACSILAKAMDETVLRRPPMADLSDDDLPAQVALDGLPKRAIVKSTPIMSDHVETHWSDLARGWKASTSKRNSRAWRLGLQPQFGKSRTSEIRDLKWECVKPPRLVLPDSKTGPKTIWLNSQALTVLEAVPREDDSPNVFPGERRAEYASLAPWWMPFRRRCALPDVRGHDLRHTVASHAAMNKQTRPTIGRLLGHASPGSTARYAHLDDEHVLDAAEQIGAATKRMMTM